MMLELLTDTQLCEQFCATVRLHRGNDGLVMLDTPFTFPDGDSYSLYLSETLTGGIRISDGGSTLMHLSYENDVDHYFTGTRGLLLKKVVKEEGVNYEDETGQFYIESAPQELSIAAFRLGQAITRVHDLNFLSRARISSTFYDDLSEQLATIVPRESIHYDYLVPGLPNADNYPVDYKFQGSAGIPVFMFGVLNREKARLVTICLQHYIQNNVAFDSLLVFENQEAIPRKDLARLTNVGGEMISSLNAEDDFRRKVAKLAA